MHPGTFYNWVSRLRKKACCEIPESISKAEPSSAPVQEVVRLNVHSKADSGIAVSCDRTGNSKSFGILNART